jgi:hypothetical protein
MQVMITWQGCSELAFLMLVLRAATKALMFVHHVINHTQQSKSLPLPWPLYYLLLCRRSRPSGVLLIKENII